MKQLFGVIGSAAVVLAGFYLLHATIGTSTAADDTDLHPGPFSNRSIQGKWGWSGSGWVVPPAVPQAVPTVGRGTVTFDGFGGCSATSTVNINGELFGPITSTSCTYAVHPDGTGFSETTFDAPGPLGGPSRQLFVIADHRKELRLIQDNLFVVHFIAKRQ